MQEHSQEAIVSQAQFDRVQELRKNKRRPAKAERQGLFSGLLFCADCGGKLHFATSKSFEGKQDHYVCNNYKSNRGTCTAHYIRNAIKLGKQKYEAMSGEPEETSGSPLIVKKSITNDRRIDSVCTRTY